VSWSLAVEEWFYVLLPLLLLAGCRLGLKFMPLLAGISVAIIIASLAARLGAHWVLGDYDYDFFRRAVVFRLDALCYGTLTYVAFVRFRALAQKYRVHLAAASIALLWLVLANHPDAPETGIFFHVFYYTLAPLLACLALPMFYHAEVQSPMVARVAAFVSTRTYALYLSHMLVALLFARFIAEISVLTLPLLLAADLAVADVLYRCFERPILRLRPTSAAGTQLARDAKTALSWNAGPLAPAKGTSLWTAMRSAGPLET
jgi:peptidoglycan/LPS O-acetylase OafA/YrhL